MKKIFKTLFLFSFSAISMAATAQQNPKDLISGKIYGAGKPTEAALVSLLNAKDSSLVKTAVSDKNGNFGFNPSKNGAYLLSANLVGYTKTYSSVFTFNGSPLTPYDLNLAPSTKQLNEVTVTSKKPLIEVQPDKMVVNVEASPTNAGATALEVLEKSPGISVDKDGNISLKGKEGVMVYMDGRPTYLSGQDLVNLLRNMQSNQLEQIEIMTNPPAKYDAAGNAGIINIKTKKTKIFGLNGSVSAGVGQGIYNRTNQNATINYRKNKVNVFGNISHNQNTSFQNISIDRRFIDNSSKQITSFFEQVNNSKRTNDNYSAKVGLDFFASKKTTLGFVANGFNNAHDDITPGDINILSTTRTKISNTQALSKSKEKWMGYGLNAYLRHIFDSTGREINIDIDNLKYDRSNNIGVYNQYYTPTGMPASKGDTLLGSLPQVIDIYSFKADYSHPLKKGAKLELGVKSSLVNTDANAIYDSVTYGKTVRDVNRSNHFIYKENINAAYINFSKPLTTKLSMQLGLRAEHTHARGNQVTTNIQFNRNYVQLFPTAYFQYTLNKNNSVGINYGRRIRRPDYESLNPFIEFLDRYTYEQGNPLLRPQISDNIELTHTFKGFLNTTINYSQTNDIIQQVLIQDNSNNTTFIKQENIASQRQIGLSVNAYNQYTKWWSGNIYVNVFYNKFSGLINNAPVTLDATTAMANISQQFKFKKGWSGELSGFYRTPALESIFNIGAFGVMNLGVSKQVMKNKGSIRLNVRDILWSQKISGYTKYDNVDANFRQYQDSRVVNLSFTYRFSKGKASTQQRQRSSADDEKSRVGGANN
jgi:hypothetical protein